MKYIDEYRNADTAKKYVEMIREITKHEWIMMEICGGQTNTIIKFGINHLLPKEITLVHGPGCPVCVTPLEIIDKAIAIASRHDVIFTSFGDMLRVPGSKKDLLAVKSEGGDVRIVYSPLDGLKLARQNSNKKIVFFAVGQESKQGKHQRLIIRNRQRSHFLRATCGLVAIKHFAICHIIPYGIDSFLCSKVK